uniref:Uncharacterized protein n=1 Tax=Anguilla anguilla TaxID=7936 RepID=A0A0E9RYL3_ANGAN
MGMKSSRSLSTRDTVTRQLFLIRPQNTTILSKYIVRFMGRYYTRKTPIATTFSCGKK